MSVPPSESSATSLQKRRNPVIRIESSNSHDASAKPLYAPKKLREDRMRGNNSSSPSDASSDSLKNAMPGNPVERDMSLPSATQLQSRQGNRIMRLPEVMELVGLGRSSIYNMMASGEFPQSAKLGKRAIGWKSVEIQDWIDKRPVG